ncbi:SDR family NAD(P)-dependent oxidoreductase [Pseudonocardia halophobica]|uniref:3-hydroxyacyl-CoA dehydrogenase n=1 Tax=Pseudonocardia halophobica TaxID=29401 RepID=A0A9W6L3V9_9PSEU|nr:SDR family NAD(P)-dependent oxidoreductase [Pseudonocardia halophobica]GLL10614.1 3-hydroxyacyl-CoA dehydrogenase [Pseudonocardia halophobica]
MEIRGAVALVTGGAGGLGEATVRRLVSAGASVVVADLAADKAKELAAELGDRVVPVPADVTSEESVLAAVAAARELGDLRIAVTAHGAPSERQRLVSREGAPLGLESFRRTVDVYLTGSYNVMRLAAAEMSRHEPGESGARGVVINTASIAAFEGQIGQIQYAAAKSGVVGMGIVAARDLAPLGIRVMTIAPGTFYTPAFGVPEEEAQQKWAGRVPFPKRMGRVDEYARLVQNIVENDYLNGEVIRLDGAQRFGPK